MRRGARIACHRRRRRAQGKRERSGAVLGGDRPRRPIGLGPRVRRRLALLGAAGPVLLPAVSRGHVQPSRVSPVHGPASRPRLLPSSPGRGSPSTADAPRAGPGAPRRVLDGGQRRPGLRHRARGDDTELDPRRRRRRRRQPGPSSCKLRRRPPPSSSGRVSRPGFAPSSACRPGRPSRQRTPGASRSSCARRGSTTPSRVPTWPAR